MWWLTLLTEMETKKFGVKVANVEGVPYAMGHLKEETVVGIVCDV